MYWEKTTINKQWTASLYYYIIVQIHSKMSTYFCTPNADFFYMRLANCSETTTKNIENLKSIANQNKLCDRYWFNLGSVFTVLMVLCRVLQTAFAFCLLLHCMSVLMYEFSILLFEFFILPFYFAIWFSDLDFPCSLLSFCLFTS